MEDIGKDDLCALLDKLLLSSLELIEQDVRLSQETNRLIADGKLDLAHTRFTKGPNAVSVVQLPTEDYNPFRALSTVAVSPDNQGVPQLTLERHAVQASEERIDPASWFGILRPPTLNSARDKFARSLDAIVERANVRATLGSYLNVFAILNKRKSVQ
ncbi:coiled-coil domain-containing protein 115-like [Anopheles cruzii]|uniref:coiled-coil domain-containing protein 115-like n=1 Tax=Anopheles cruzii TaxID=68878 RepID=UPI0022EC71E2|nr:coiled-coil domain-containing protein 115-like [Anopheles cruzii]